MITPEQERAFYDRQYAQFLAMPDHALRMDRAVLLGNMSNPEHPFFERRRLYRAAMVELEAEPLAGKRVLDYGCGPADFGLWMAAESAEVTLLDLSPLAIELGLKRAQASGVARRVKGVAADAAKLDMFADGAFDLVFACASLHHTMKYPGALEELARVMRPGARLVLCETWGGNRPLNAARRWRARRQGEEEEQGEAIILAEAEIELLRRHFGELRVHQLSLLAMGKRLLRGRFRSAWARAAVMALEATDRVALATCPPLRAWCGEAVITARR
ncbi:MAG: class I SAM-dependent methyltransferase [Candidatus Solibacter usitatus]|nr:class I SAM-dependent methyltransferase [Candidatus Solibacter usitatus]